MSAPGGDLRADAAPDPRGGAVVAGWWSRVPWPAVDAAVAAASTAGAMILLVVGDDPGRRAPDLLGFGLLLAAGAPLAARRRWPATATVVTAVTAVAYLALAYPGAPITVPVLVAVYGAAAWERRGAALAVVGFFVVVGSAHRLVVQEHAFSAVAFQGLLYVFAWLSGELVRSRRQLRSEVEQRLERAARDRDREAARRVQQERLRIARELHDVMAHTVSSMTVQAGVVADLLDEQPEQARAALTAMRRASRDAMAELRATVNLLRSGTGEDAPLPPTPGLADLDRLVEQASRDGLTVDLVTAGEPRPVPAAIELTAYRIVQEALTNVVRHARAHVAIVSTAYESDVLVVEVTDDGHGGGGHIHPGFGVVGMRERAEAVGGRLEVGPAPDGGFRVYAVLPLAEDAR